MSDRLRTIALYVLLALFLLVLTISLVKNLLLSGLVSGAGAAFAAFMLGIHVGYTEKD